MLSTFEETMKKLVNKLRNRKKTPPPSRITSDTIDQHREHILAGGRKFKYPIQYSRHKLIYNAIIISVSVIIIALIFGWWQLYPQQNTSEFMYRVTKILPVPVANVDGQPVLYSDYLMKYLSQVHYLVNIERVNIKTDNGKRQIDYIKQQSMQGVIADAYALKLSKNLGVSVSKSEIDASIRDQRKTSDGTETTKQAYDAITLDYYNWSPDEYSHVTKSGLVRQKVMYAMDKDALKTANSVSDALKKDPQADLKNLATTTITKADAKATYGSSGWVPNTNQDGGLTVEAAKLKKSEISSVIKSTLDKGFYVIRLIDTKDDQVKYEYINIPLTAFTKSLENLKKSGKISEYISIPKSIN